MVERLGIVIVLFDILPLPLVVRLERLLHLSYSPLVIPDAYHCSMESYYSQGDCSILE